MATYKVTNLAKEDFRDTFCNQEYVIPAGKTGIVPDDACSLWFGHSTLLDQDREPLRRQEFERLKIRYGAYDDVDLWEREKPLVTVEDIEGNKITTVIEDPTGETISPAPALNTDLQVLEEEVRKQQRQIGLLMEELERRKGQESALQVELPKDEPGSAPKPREPKGPPKAASE